MKNVTKGTVLKSIQKESINATTLTNQLFDTIATTIDPAKTEQPLLMTRDQFSNKQ